MNYVVITKEQALAIANGEDLEISCGKRIKKIITVKSDLERKKAAIDAKYQAALEKLGVTDAPEVVG